MLKDVTLGQYYSVDSPLHKIDPRVKIRFTIIYILLLLIDRNIVLFGFMTGILLVGILLSNVPLKHILRGSRSIYVFVLICSTINIFTTPGDALVSGLGITVTYEGILKFAFVFWRMVLIIISSSLMMYCTTPTELTDGFEKCFRLSGNVAMGITIALRFISVLFEELDRIMKAQEARGADFRTGGPIKKLRSYKTVIVPLFQNSIDRAANLSEAMDARCYTGGKGRTKLNPLKYDRRDIICYILILLMIVAGIWMAVRF